MEKPRVKYTRVSLQESSIAEEPQHTLPSQASQPKHPLVENDRLNSKLRQIQSNKELLERKISEYERKLKRDQTENTNSMLSQDSGKSRGSRKLSRAGLTESRQVLREQQHNRWR